MDAWTIFQCNFRKARMGIGPRSRVADIAIQEPGAPDDVDYEKRLAFYERQAAGPPRGGRIAEFRALVKAVGFDWDQTWQALGAG